LRKGQETGLQCGVNDLRNQVRKDIAGDVCYLSRQGRLDLLEVCTPPDSGLGAEVEKLGGNVYRAGIHTGHDLSTNGGLRRLMLVAKARKPRRMVASPPCGPFCPLQRLNQRNAQQITNLAEKRRKGRRVWQNIKRLFEFLATEVPDCECEFEQPRDSDSWRETAARDLRQQLFETSICGCAYGVRCEKTGELHKKPWTIISTDPGFTKIVNKWCSKRKGSATNHRHHKLEGGSVVSRSAAYPPALCRIWALLIMRGRLRPEDADSILLLREQCYWGDIGDEGELADSEGEEETVTSETPHMQAEARDKCQAGTLA